MNTLLNAFALFGDKLTAYQLEYREPHPHGDETRFQAGARLASMGGVIPFDTPGYFVVVSDDPRRVAPYNVCALPGELFCPCPDGTHSKHNQSGLCKHVIGALIVATIQEA